VAGRGRETEENKRGRRKKKEGTRRIAEKVNILP
jgi:transposase-like protein